MIFRSLWFACEASLKLCDQGRQRFRLFVRGEVATWQPLDREPKLAKSFLREVDLLVFEGIFVAAAHQERKLVAISLEEVAEVESVALRSVISLEASCRGKVEQTIVAVHSAMEFAQLGVCYVIASGPHLPYSWHSFE